MVEGEEALDAEMSASEDLFIEVGAKFLEIVETVGHGSSEVNHNTPTPPVFRMCGRERTCGGRFCMCGRERG